MMIQTSSAHSILATSKTKLATLKTNNQHPPNPNYQFLKPQKPPQLAKAYPSNPKKKLNLPSTARFPFFLSQALTKVSQTLIIKCFMGHSIWIKLMP
jgi:hypothetical protein